MKYPVAIALYVPGSTFLQISNGLSGYVILKNPVSGGPFKSAFLPSTVTYIFLRKVCCIANVNLFEFLEYILHDNVYQLAKDLLQNK